MYDIISKDKQALDEIEALWMQLNDVHHNDSTYFAESFRQKNYEQRKQELMRLAKHGEMKVFLCYDNGEAPIGYCLAHIVTQAGQNGILRCIRGEIDSLCVDRAYRNKGIGTKLLEAGLDWCQQHKPEQMQISVAYGHESVYHLYGKYGFFPRLTVLNQKKISIRPVTVDQLEQCLSVIHEGFMTIAVEFGLTKEKCPTNGAFLSMETFRRYYDSGTPMYALYSGNQMVGFLQLYQVSDKEIELGKLTVLPSYRHFGLGSRLLEFAKEKASEMGGEKLTIGIIEENTVVRKWYEQHGFKHLGTKKYEHLPFTVGFMEQPLR